MSGMAGDWHELDTLEQIQALQAVFGGFHDGCVREIRVSTSHSVAEDLSMHFDAPAAVHVLIQRQFRNPSAIELRFTEVIGLRFSPPPPNYDAIIFGAAFFQRDGILYWAEAGGWDPGSPDRDRCTWVAARHAWWRDASDWMGPELRYRQDR